jgi:hypothetical protein
MTVLDWLLDADPSIRWRVLRDLTGAPAEDVAAERARVTAEGWGARLLALQGDDGQWAGGAYFPARSGGAEDGDSKSQPWRLCAALSPIEWSTTAARACASRRRWW